jgi:hypothetical protein
VVVMVRELIEARFIGVILIVDGSHEHLDDDHHYWEGGPLEFKVQWQCWVVVGLM